MTKQKKISKERKYTYKKQQNNDNEKMLDKY